MPHQHTVRNFIHLALAIRDLSNRDLFQIIPNPGSQMRVSLLLESICTIPFQAGASDVKIPQLRLHSSNCGMPCLINIFGTFPGTWDHPDKNPGAHFCCTATIFSNIADRDIQRPGMLNVQKIGRVSLVKCTYDCHDCRSGWKWILCIPPAITYGHLAVDSTTLRVSKAYQFKIEVCLRWEMCQKEFDTFENIPVE
jgi:hypothetical protein